MKAAPSDSSTAGHLRAAPETGQFVRRHLRFGWWSLLVFLTLGIGLEALHGFKAGWYLNVSNEMRRLMWTLAHAHGTLLSLVHIAFAVTLPHLSTSVASARALASRCLMAASVLLPGGFFLGGLILHGADPGLGIVLVPIGALLLFTSVFLIARAVCGNTAPDDMQTTRGERDRIPGKVKR
jgi:hypothetical protein